MNNYEYLISRLDRFIRKYYFNQLLRGALLFSACLLIYILIIALGEYFFYFPPQIKWAILGLLLLAGGWALINLIILPLAKLYRLGATLSYERAAKIIGTHFPEISDKLLNVLQLHDLDTKESQSLIAASIDQKASQIAVVPIQQAIDLRKNKKMVPWVAVPLLLMVVAIWILPGFWKETSQRLLQPGQRFLPPAPFAFHITSDEMQVPMYSDYTLVAEVKGDKLPDKVFIDIGPERVEMQKDGKARYRYTFSRIGSDIDFRLTAAKVSSDAYRLTVIPKPSLQSFALRVEFPAYIGRKSETLDNLTDMNVPEGTVFHWSLKALHTDEVRLKIGDTGTPALLKKDNATWSGQYRFVADTTYTLFLTNKEIVIPDSFKYNVKVSPDLPPQVQAQQIKDSITGQQILITGNASDDYGISRLLFRYSIHNANKEVVTEKSMLLKSNGGTLVPFQYYFDLGALPLAPGQEVHYYMEAWDNDGVNGSKRTRSDIYTYRPLDGREADSAMGQNAQQIEQGLKSGAEQSKKLQTEIKDLQNRLLQSNTINWEKQQDMKSLMQKQLDLKDQIENIKKRFEQQKKQSQQKEHHENIQEKQDAIEKQLDNLLNKELEEQLKKLEELMKNMNKENAFQELQQLEQKNKLFQMDMQRIQELMKKLEMQMKMDDLAKKMDRLAEKELELQKKTEANDHSNEKLIQEQQSIQKELKEAVSQDLKKLESLNKEQTQPESLDKVSQAAQEAGENMQQGNNELGKNQQQKASQSQSKAAQNLQNMAASLQQMAAGMDIEQIDIDIKATRQILTNLIRFSFDQEKLMQTVKKTPANSPKFVTNTQEQGRLKNNAKMIKDSLYALSKRVFKIAATINKETSLLEANIQSTLSAMENRRVPEVLTRQQYAMTSANNLALLLNELLENLMQDKAQAQSMGNGSCNKPGGKGAPKPGSKGGAGQMMKDIVTGQQQLGNSMSGKQGKSNKAGEQGKPEGDGKGKGDQNGKSGGQEGGGDGNDAEQLARMAQQQAELRKQIQQLSSLLNSKGMSGNARELKAIQEEMDKNETDMVNKRWNAQLMQRQNQIMTRLLEAEKAIRNQEEDDKRSANSGKDEQRPLPPELLKHVKDQQTLLELFKTAPPVLKPYYKNMSERYLKQISPEAAGR